VTRDAAGALATKLATIPTVKLASSPYVTCQPLTNFAAAGYTNLLVRARLFTEATCNAANEVTAVTCHPWCAALEMRAGVNTTCCGVGPYYTIGVVDVLQWK
jgi:hypothetical protein